MDKFFDRLGDVIKNFLEDEDDRLFGRSSRASPGGDPDLDAAYDELNDFLKTGKSEPRSGPRPWADPQDAGASYGWSDHRAGSRESTRQSAKPAAPGVPESLRPDFQELGVPFGSDAATCKAAYKKLLKIHHPDRHAGHPGNMKKATEKSSRINASFRRIEEWRSTGRVE